MLAEFQYEIHRQLYNDWRLSMIDKRLKNSLKVAVLELCCGDQPLRDRLKCAIRTLDGFLGQREAWPAVLYSRAQDISDELNSAQTTEAAIEALDLPGVQRLAERILHLYADCYSQGEQN
jgi:hypothetical protein